MKNSRKNNIEFVHLGHVINKILKTSRYKYNEELSKIWELWDSAVGKDVANNAQPAAFKGKLLLVHVSSSVWIQQLQFLKKDLIVKVNHVLKKDLVEEIKFKIGSL